MPVRIDSKFAVELMRTLVLIMICLVVTLPQTTPASASTNCRQIARDIQSDGLAATTSDPSGQATLKVFTDAVTAYPECKSEIEILWEWNLARDPSLPFPFAKSGDPKVYPLGPISWWWDLIYKELFDSNTLLMILFGWELFLMPFPIIFALILVPIRLVFFLFRRNQK